MLMTQKFPTASQKLLKAAFVLTVQSSNFKGKSHAQEKRRQSFRVILLNVSAIWFCCGSGEVIIPIQSNSS